MTRYLDTHFLTTRSAHDGINPAGAVAAWDMESAFAEGDTR
jgi:hypothetical protein